MMTQRYIDYANYNIWANDRLIHDLSKVDSGLMDQEVDSSFPTIRATVQHMWFAETGWLSRMRGQGWQTDEVTDFEGSAEELFKAWQTTSADFRDFVETAELEDLVSFDHKGEHFSIPNREIMQTVFNHGSYHRGQVVTMMRQLGITEISQGDYIEWVREYVRRARKS